MIKNKGITLIELSLAISILAIIMAVVIIAINPGQRLAEGRDNRRESDIQIIYGTIEYSIQHHTTHGINFPATIPGSFQEICNTPYAASCEGLVDLSGIFTGNIPRDPQVEAKADGTGYEIAMQNGTISIRAVNAETRSVSIGPDL